MIVIVTSDKINTNANVMFEFHPIANKTNNFYLHIAIINIIYTIIHTTETPAVIYAIMNRVSLFIIIHGTTLQTLKINIIVMLDYDKLDLNTHEIAEFYLINNKYNYLSLTITIISVIMTEKIVFQTKMLQLLLIKHIDDDATGMKQVCETEFEQASNNSRANTHQYTTTTIINEMTSVINILIEISILPLFSYVLTIVIDRIMLNLDKQPEFECDYANNDNVTIITNSFHKFRATSIVFAFFGFFFSFILQTIDTSLLNIAPSIKFEAFVITIVGLILTFAVQSSISAVSIHTQMVRDVCAIFSYLFPFVHNF